MSTKLVIPNIIKSLDRTLLLPTRISDNGEYINNHVKWDLPSYKGRVSYCCMLFRKCREVEAVFNAKWCSHLYLKALETYQALFYNCLAKQTKQISINLDSR
ncbi:hypothetical protein BOQ23_04525 [Listeria monocytogenes]|nr:hypothetical protein [Listeria monocytogenes]